MARRPFTAVALSLAAPFVFATVALPGAGPAVAAAASPPAAPSAAAYAPRPMPMPADFLPVPADAAAQAARRCPAGTVRTEPKDLAKNDETARRMVTQLRMWGEKHFRFEGPAGCTDFDFVISQWQAMAGLPVTGVLGAAEVASVREAILKIQPQLQAAQAEWSRARGEATKAGVDPNTGRAFTPEQLAQRRQREAANAAAVAARNAAAGIVTSSIADGPGPEPTVLEFLPKAPGPTDRECLDGRFEAQRWAFQQAQMGRLPTRDVYGPGEPYLPMVPAHWGAFSQRNPEVGLWTQSRSPAGCPARTKLRAWLKAIGDGSNIDDPNSTRGTTNHLVQVRAQLREAQARHATARDAWLARERERAAALAVDPAELARTRDADLASLAPGAKAAAVAATLPAALCTRTGETWTCAKARDGCAAEREVLAERRKRVDAALGRAQLAQMFGGGPGTPPTLGAQTKQDLTDAELLLQRCEIVHPATAAGRSQLRYGPTPATEATLAFEGDELVEMRFTVAGDAVAVSNLLTRRYGAPQTDFEQRSFVTRELLPGVDPLDDEVIEHTTTVNVPHETWSAKGVVVRGSQGRYTVLRTDAR